MVSLYQSIYCKGDRAYWAMLDEEMQRFTAEEGLMYVRDDDSVASSFEEPPVVVNYFFHEKIVPSAKKKNAVG